MTVRTLLQDLLAPGAPGRGSGIREVIQPMVTPNGIGLSPDGRTLYVAETEPGRLWAFDVAEVGVLGPPAGFAPGRVVANMPGYQLFDSLAVYGGRASGWVRRAVLRMPPPPDRGRAEIDGHVEPTAEG